MVPLILLLILLTEAASYLPVVPVRPEGDVILSCQAADPFIRAIEWTRADLKTDNVLLYTDGHLNTTHQHPSYKGRVELVDRDLKDGNMSLILKNVNINDSGTYKCQVKTNDTDRIKTISTIRLQVPDQIVVTVDPGDDAILPCHAADSSIIFVEWSRPGLKPDDILYYRNEYLNTTYQHPDYKDRVELVDRDLKDRDASLILKNVCRHDTETYECRVKTSRSGRPKGDTDYYQIRTICLQVTDLTVTVRPGDDVILPCHAADSSIRAVKWTRPDLEPNIVLLYSDGHLEKDDQNPSFKDRVELVDRDLKDRDASLILKNVSRHDTGIYECRVKTDGSTRKKRGIEPVRIIRLQVTEPAGSKKGNYLIYVVAAGVGLIFLTVAVVGVIYKICNNRRSGQPAAAAASTDQLLDNSELFTAD
ncbi:V-set and immunoglobulin domain-containing protein 8-like [Perca fluviatilis]|uniref:V-set and immunoglobulin domain-containing protein 8-like n=1 Tax=Perca fluviatilis TaxID=8168 RepID=UPI001965C801|nr:V-set and immunoglobulin domain-containing protein 8-like [Perca fluviatilis]